MSRPHTTGVTRPARADDLDAVVALAVDAQSDAQRRCPYLSDDAASIAADVIGVEAPDGGPWHHAAAIAESDDGRPVGWLLAESDPAMGRIWWWGPLVAGHDRLDGDLRASVADRLFGTLSSALTGFDQHELAVDAESALLAAFAERHGFRREEASVALRTESLSAGSWPSAPDVVAASEADRAALASLHDRLFAGSHTPGARLLDGDSTVLVVRDGGDLAGYVVTELQHDGSLYVDYVGVAETSRHRGLGGSLVTTAVAAGARAGAGHAHLTVRAGNGTARRLYGRLGFVEDRIIVPYRRGFGLDRPELPLQPPV